MSGRQCYRWSEVHSLQKVFEEPQVGSPSASGNATSGGRGERQGAGPAPRAQGPGMEG